MVVDYDTPVMATTLICTLLGVLASWAVLRVDQ